VGLHVLEALPARERGQGADLIHQVVGDLGRGRLQGAAAEPAKVRKAGMGPDAGLVTLGRERWPASTPGRRRGNPQAMFAEVM